MSLLSRSMAMKLGLAGAVAVLATGGTVAGLTVASAAPAPHLAATATIDHQLCYVANASGFVIPPNITLENQFSPKGFTPEIGPVAFHCNPVAKTLPSGQVFPITNPDAHLLCWNIAAPVAQPAPEVKVTNQFGSADLQPGQPNLLCLPTWKSLTGPPGQTPDQPPGLSHFTCYPVKVVKGAYKPPPVMLQDEFAPQPVNAEVNPVPAELCLPTTKIVGKTVYKMVNAKWHLLCYPVSQTPIISPVYDQNQFVPPGSPGLPVQIGQTTWLCVPSTKTLVS
jgi:hypothetical protein